MGNNFACLTLFVIRLDTCCDQKKTLHIWTFPPIIVTLDVWKSDIDFLCMLSYDKCLYNWTKWAFIKCDNIYFLNKVNSVSHQKLSEVLFYFILLQNSILLSLTFLFKYLILKRIFPPLDINRNQQLILTDHEETS